MATIITQKQPSWQVQLATSILAPLIGNYINKAMERSENAYNNKRLQAALAENNPQPEPQVNILGMSNPLMQQSGNGWENAARQGMNALADFDMNTANLASPMATTQPTPARVPTMADMNAALIRNAGHASLPTLQAQFNPYIQAQEAARIEGLKREAGENIANASPDNRLAELWRYYSQGLIPFEAVTGGDAQARARWPQAYNLDTGGQLIQGNRDPVTGVYSPQITTDRTLTPQQVAQNQQWERTFNEGVKRADQEFNYRRDTQNLARQDSLQPRYGAPFPDENGNWWQIDQYGNPRPVMHNGQQLRGAQPNTTQNGKGTNQAGTLTKIDEERLKILNNDIENKQKELAAAKKTLNESYSSTVKAEAQKDITRLTTEIETLKQQRKEFLDSRSLPAQSQPSTQGQGNNSGNHGITIGQRLIPEGFSGRYEAHHKFGHDRKTHKHAGVDLLAKEGSPIKADSLLGSNLRVVDVSNNPKDPSNYGCHVRLEGTTPDGYTYYYIFGHMKEGSIKVKRGDIINPGDTLGQVGSTGRSTAPHLHFEIRPGGRGGKPIDPEKFFAQYGVTPAPIAQGAITPMPPSTTTPPPAGTQSGDVTVQTQNQGGNNNQQTQQQGQKYVDDSEKMFIHPDGRYITRWDFLSALEKKRREDGGKTTEADLSQEFINEGFVRQTLSQEKNLYDNATVWRRGDELMTRAEYEQRVKDAEQQGQTREDVDKDLVRLGYMLVEPAMRQTTPGTNIPSVTVAGITSDDTTQSVAATPPTSPDIPAQPRSANVQTQPQSPELSIDFKQKEAEYRRNFNDNTPYAWVDKSGNPIRTEGGTPITEKLYEYYCRAADEGKLKKEGFNSRTDIDEFLKNEGGIRVTTNNDANLAIVVGGDTAHSPGPVHTNETPESQNQELSHLNGETSGDVTPTNIGSPSWSAFLQRPYNFGTSFNGMPSRYANNLRQYNIR